MLGLLGKTQGQGAESLALPDLLALQMHLAGGACTLRKLAGESKPVCSLLGTQWSLHGHLITMSSSW